MLKSNAKLVCACTWNASNEFLIVTSKRYPSSSVLQQGNGYEAEPRSSFVEGARDVAVLEAMLESGSKGGTLVNVKKF